MTTKPATAQLHALERPEPLPAKPPGSGDFLSSRFPLFDRWSTHPGQGLTPRRITAIYQSAERGWPQEQCDLFDDVIESDAHLRSQLESRVSAVAGKEWIVQAGGDSAADISAAKAFEAALRAVPNFPETLEHLLTSNWYGYAAAEVVWELKDIMGDGNLLVAPVWFAHTPPRRFVFDDGDTPRILTAEKHLEGEALEPGRWVFARRRHRISAMAGLMRTATWWSLFKRMAVRDWVILAERFGLPYVTGEYADDMPEKEKDILRKAVASIGKDGFACFSATGKIVIHALADGGKSGDIHGSMTSLCNSEMSKLVSGATLGSDTGGPGSFALGKVHQDRGFDLTVGDAAFVSRVIEQQLGAAFVHFNGMAARPPKIKFHLVRPDVNPEVRMRIFASAANLLGLEIDADQIREEFQIKPVSGDALKGTQPGTGGDPLE